MKKCFRLFALLLTCSYLTVQADPADSAGYWHQLPRTIRYRPDGTDLVITNGNRRFTRALYGTHTAFRVEAGDLPEFALYLPGMGGNLKFGIIGRDTSKWLIHAQRIVARYRPGSMNYEITDPLLEKGSLLLQVLAMADAEGMIVKLTAQNLPAGVNIIWAFGGVSGKKFSRDGDLNVDPESSFYLKPAYCATNRFTLHPNGFTVYYSPRATLEEVNRYQTMAQAADSAALLQHQVQTVQGFFPPHGLHIGDATAQSSPLALFESHGADTPLVTGRIRFQGQSPVYLALQKPDAAMAGFTYDSLAVAFRRAELARAQLADRIRIQTPDPFINPLGGVISMAADAIWEAPTFLHGAIGWRMRLNGWRGPYAGDVLGWHDRARMHFRSYARSQLTIPPGPVVMDTALRLARSLERLGTSVFSEGYISRNPDGDLKAHHYDMNLVYIDQLLRHFNWTGDTAFVREMWPVLRRHLAWEKRNFDPDGDGLYDAYAAIWASDALQYSGGAVAHSSAYNYYANRQAAVLAGLIGEDSGSYRQEADKIFQALQAGLWMPDRGSYAEFRDGLGQRALHPYAGLWTYYHTIDSEVPDPFQAYQTLKWIDHYIPHIPVRAKGLPDGYYTLSTTNWMPYDWSLNNVATAEVMHTALASWQGGRKEEAFRLWKSELLSTMYLGSSAGNIGQISFYDAARGEAYRDFGDPVGMTARSLVEGLFGILPDALHARLVIRPGFPAAWKKASIRTPDIAYSFATAGNVDTYTIKPAFTRKMTLHLQVTARKEKIASITINGRKADWQPVAPSVGQPTVEIYCPPAATSLVKITWAGNGIEQVPQRDTVVAGSPFRIALQQAIVKSIRDPQKSLLKTIIDGKGVLVTTVDQTGPVTFFLQVQQGTFTWWQPCSAYLIKPVEVRTAATPVRNRLQLVVQNHTHTLMELKLGLTEIPAGPGLRLQAHESLEKIVSDSGILPGTNRIFVTRSASGGKVQTDSLLVVNWLTAAARDTRFEKVDLQPYFNDRVTRVFQNRYLSPRPATATLQLPVQGIGDWTHPLKTAIIDDRGLRAVAGAGNEIRLPQGIPLATPSDTLQSNIVFTSQWDRYPQRVDIPLTGSARHAYLLMAGSTNPMQSRMVNGTVTVHYTDGSSDCLPLRNPETWWPIEQDYLEDGYAFRIGAPRPVRVHLKTGKILSDYDNSLAATAGKMIEGGAATVLDLPLRSGKTLKTLQLEAMTNDVVIGLMSLTLVR